MLIFLHMFGMCTRDDALRAYAVGSQHGRQEHVVYTLLCAERQLHPCLLSFSVC